VYYWRRHDVLSEQTSWSANAGRAGTFHTQKH
jgi:hypothetical protein